MTAILARLGVPRRINAAGTLTRLGGSLMAPEVVEAMRQAAACSLDMAELQAAAGAVIARATGMEAGMVTSGAAAGLTLAAAACLAGSDIARMAALPDSRGMPNEILMARTHRNAYDHALRAAGARIIDIGHNDRGTGAGIRGIEAWEIEAAITPATAAFAFAATPDSLGDLPVVLEACRRHGVPVIVDAAAQLPPKSNLAAFAAADLVVFSGGKAIGGPQPTGLLAGRRDLIASALLQQQDMDVSPATWSPPPLIDRNRFPFPPHHGLGRGFKVGKEEICGLVAALDLFLARDEAAWLQGLRDRLAAIAAGLGERARLLPAGKVPLLEVSVADGPAAVRRLLARPLPIHVGERRAAAGILTVDLQAVRPEDDAILAEGLADCL
ncbi:MAG: DgaE family pyridoxal phosphate-dependent ammonia lyase [Thalassobaculales bacterium]